MGMVLKPLVEGFCCSCSVKKANALVVNTDEMVNCYKGRKIKGIKLECGAEKVYLTIKS